MASKPQGLPANFYSTAETRSAEQATDGTTYVCSVRIDICYWIVPSICVEIPRPQRVLRQEPPARGVVVTRPQVVETRITVSLLAREEPLVRTCPALRSNSAEHIV